jgi:hypothetical protein
MFQALLSPGGVHQDAPHRLGRCRKEMGAILPAWLCVRAEPKPRFMNQRCGLKGLAGRFARHLLGGELPQLAVNQGDQLLGCF